MDIATEEFSHLEIIGATITTLLDGLNGELKDAAENVDVWKGLVVTLGGIFVIGLVDNVLRPIVVGRDTKLPDWLILISTLGGIAVFGLAGFVAGPVLAALFLVMWELFAEEYVVPGMPTPTIPARPA